MVVPVRAGLCRRGTEHHSGMCSRADCREVRRVNVDSSLEELAVWLRKGFCEGRGPLGILMGGG